MIENKKQKIRRCDFYSVSLGIAHNIGAGGTRVPYSHDSSCAPAFAVSPPSSNEKRFLQWLARRGRAIGEIHYVATHLQIKSLTN